MQEIRQLFSKEKSGSELSLKSGCNQVFSINRVSPLLGKEPHWASLFSSPTTHQDQANYLTPATVLMLPVFNQPQVTPGLVSSMADFNKFSKSSFFSVRVWNGVLGHDNTIPKDLEKHLDTMGINRISTHQIQKNSLFILECILTIPKSLERSQQSRIHSQLLLRWLGPTS